MSNPENLTAILVKIKQRLIDINESRLFSEIYQWQSPSIDKDDIALICTELIIKIESIAWDESDEKTKQMFEKLVRISIGAEQYNLNNLYGSPAAIEALISTLYLIDFQLNSSTEFKEASGKRHLENVAITARNIEAVLVNMKGLEGDAKGISGKLGITYSAATSAGLAKAFKQRADALNGSTYFWLFCLLAALLIAGGLGWHRFPEILSATTGKPDWGVVFINLTLGVVTLLPPAWFAWVSTKQIKQQSRLAEDYSYKAALSAAYEGYRIQAKNFDNNFSERLFSIVIDRLDELPVRLVETDNSGSPIHEFIKSNEFRKTKNNISDSKDRILDKSKSDPSTETTRTG